ncbi:MAG TPA: type IV secretory system conjugative DNA transfer family protein [Streptosporangiaceae bacterium]|nr:type IV secretory system conjugative DNA transfer family protein [Streptosporangiaceae bacterium]
MTAFLILLAFALAVALAAKLTLFSSDRVRRMRWRIMFRLRPGPGFATCAELAIRWSRLAALHHGRRVRPSMRLHHRLTAATTEYAVRLGRAQYFRPVFARAEDQTIILSLPRSGKSGMLADRVIDHPGAALVTESRPDIYAATAGYRARLGPVEIFNPENVSGIPSTFRWGMTIGCQDPSEAIRRAADLVGAVANVGEMAWWVEKSAAALAAGMHAAALIGGDMGDVWAWASGYGAGVVDDARTHPAASPELFGALAELDRPGKTADSIRLTMSKALTWLAIPGIRAMVTGPAARPFNVGAFTDKRGTIYMLAPGGDGAPCAPLFRCFASYVHRAARHHGLAAPHRKLDPGLLFALDELHLCPVDLPAWLADSAGKGIQVAAVVHSTGQLRDKYGEHGADTVWSTAGTKIFLPGIHDTATLEDVSRLCGTLGDGGKARRVMPPELLARLPDWHALVISVNRSPVVIRFRPSWRRTEARLGLAPRPLPVHGYPVPGATITEIDSSRPAGTPLGVQEDHGESAKVGLRGSRGPSLNSRSEHDEPA